MAIICRVATRGRGLMMSYVVGWRTRGNFIRILSHGDTYRRANVEASNQECYQTHFLTKCKFWKKSQISFNFDRVETKHTSIVHNCTSQIESQTETWTHSSLLRALLLSRMLRPWPEVDLERAYYWEKKSSSNCLDTQLHLRCLH